MELLKCHSDYIITSGDKQTSASMHDSGVLGGTTLISYLLEQISRHSFYHYQVTRTILLYLEHYCGFI